MKFLGAYEYLWSYEIYQEAVQPAITYSKLTIVEQGVRYVQI